MPEKVKPENWYAVTKIDHGITYICEPFIKEFYRCNIWHVRGALGDMLVDSGMGVVSLKQWVPLVAQRTLTAVASHKHISTISVATMNSNIAWFIGKKLS